MLIIVCLLVVFHVVLILAFVCLHIVVYVSFLSFLFLLFFHVFLVLQVVVIVVIVTSFVFFLCVDVFIVLLFWILILNKDAKKNDGCFHSLSFFFTPKINKHWFHFLRKLRKDLPYYLERMHTTTTVWCTYLLWFHGMDFLCY